MRIIVASLISLLIISCGGGSSSNPSNVDIPNTPSIVNPIHPLIWESATPESVGMSSSRLEEAFNYVFQDGSFTQAAVVIKDGKLVYEKYRGMTDNEANALASTLGENADFYKSLYEQRDQNSYISSWSTAKSFTSFLIGIAVESGSINSIEDSASNYITEWSSDERSSITIKNLLDMRSGLPPACYNFGTNEIGECINAGDSSSGGNIVYADDQLTKCIDRELASQGVTHPWYDNGSSIYSRGAFQYSNCDTMVLGEIIFRATGQDVQTYAEYNLFSKIGIDASWWRDFTSSGQSNGNYLAYCCLDSTARDFAKFGHMLLLGGVWEGDNQKYASYVELIKNLNSYGLQFWTICAKAQSNSNCDEWIVSTIGFDGQYIMIDFQRNVVVVRASLYTPIQNLSQDRKMKLNPSNLAQSNWIATVPNALGSSAGSNISVSAFYELVANSIN
ncbi:MAG: serine hydrolase domain-containing protein [Gammaproteobacteria bacterium]|tara:strand:- start:14 stop:1357 length:1344 start_codon:yes stop_codon:yes gene_type:complete